MNALIFKCIVFSFEKSDQLIPDPKVSKPIPKDLKSAECLTEEKISVDLAETMGWVRF